MLKNIFDKEKKIGVGVGVGFTLPKEEAKDGNIASRAMSFGEDFNTRVFRNFVS